jgi:hypothetical protein
VAAVIVSIVALIVLGSGASSATSVGTVAASPVNRTFSFINKPNSSTRTLININSLLVNARCDSRGNPVVFAFTSAGSADIFGRMFDGFGRGHIIKNSAFTRASKGVSLSPNVAGDFNSSGTVMFERSNGQVVTVNYAFDNATTLNRQNLCTVYGSVTAT